MMAPATTPSATQELLAERFWAKVDKRGPDECWPWLGATNGKPAGHGALTVCQKRHYAHRVSWELAFGPIPVGLWVLYRCDNPPCCNPAHLFLGTVVDNVADMDAKGRRVVATRLKMHCHRGHPLFGDNIYVPPSAPNTRICRQCRLVNRRAYVARKRMGD